MLRFSSNPTHDLSINDLRIVLLNHIVAKQNNENMIIRIEESQNIDQVDKKEKELSEILHLFAIDYMQITKQNNNLKYHQQIAMQLLIDKKAFNCFCSDDALKQDRIKLEKEKKPYAYSGFCDTLHDETTINLDAPFRVRIKKPQSPASDQVDSFTILNQNKRPTYSFASAIDDMLSNITLVIEDAKHLNDAPKQTYIQKQIGYEQEIRYIHISSLIDPDRTTIKELIDDGFLPAAIVNYILSLGYQAPSTIFSLEDAITWYDIETLSKENITFDKKQLQKINQIYIKNLDDMRLSKIIAYADEDIGKLAKLYLDECFTIHQLKEKIDSIFHPKNDFVEFLDSIDTIRSVLQKAPFIEEYDQFRAYLSNHTNLDEKGIENTLKIILTGSIQGPDLKDVYPLIKNYLGEIL